jgi:hypothetical protein
VDKPHELLSTSPFTVPASRSVTIELDYFKQAGRAWFDAVSLERMAP